MGRQRSSKTIRSASDAPPARHYFNMANRNSTGARSFQAVPQIVIFGRRQGSPSAGTQVKIGAYSEICPVYVCVAAVGSYEVRLAKPISYKWQMLVEAVDTNCASHGMDALSRQHQLIAQPSRRHETVSVGIAQPTKLASAPVTSQRLLRRPRARVSHNTGIRFYHISKASQQALTNLARSIGGSIGHENNVKASLRKNGQTCLLDGI
jgi:hypothetical protein